MSGQLVTGHAQMAPTFLGQVDDPRTGKPDGVDTRAVKVFIDPLERLRSETRGDRDAEGTRLLAPVPDVVRTGCVEVIDAAASAAKDGARRPGGPAELR